MGVPFLCPRHSGPCDLQNGFESGGNENECLHQQSVDDSRGAVALALLELDLDPPSSVMGDGLDPSTPEPKHEAAAIKLQKVYKSFRTRRNLADCAVLIEQSCCCWWWKLLDFAQLKHSSVSFFDLGKRETAVSRWSRARTRAAKVGKGLSKNGKAQKLALQHWLEAIDPRHRYGHNLHFYYVQWLNSQSMEPFFYWLDIGEGKEVNLVDKCPRAKLQQQCIKYLGPMERKAYEVVVEGGQLFYKQTGEALDTTKEPKGSKWIFVLSTSGSLYAGMKKKGSFQHSSFLAGGATLAAGRIVAENGVLKAVWPHSGHYRPTPENFQDLLSFLRDNNVDLTGVKLESTDEEDEQSDDGNKRGVYLRSNSFEDDGHRAKTAEAEEEEEAETATAAATVGGMPVPPCPSSSISSSAAAAAAADSSATSIINIPREPPAAAMIHRPHPHPHPHQEVIIINNSRESAAAGAGKQCSSSGGGEARLRDYNPSGLLLSPRPSPSPRSKYRHSPSLRRLDIIIPHTHTRCEAAPATATGTYLSCSTSHVMQYSSSSVDHHHHRSLQFLSRSPPPVSFL
ncbi:IQ domain-containing protein IQM2-like [Andrographis paniculata]|uniref:IQ domain-containing protein IQM2-like n=1 Tax=Andrographis paniculata TaxID=175694 RepID=UPI0021E8800B|nr:IQ domain-containing protein IQM2-like [Andrographis paniculata]